MIQIKKISIVLNILLLFTSAGYAQEFSEKAILDTVYKTGFYNIVINPVLSSYIKTDFSDIRIADDKGQYQPYIISTAIKGYYSNDYRKLEIVKNELQDSGRSVIIIKNNSNDQINDIALQIRNAAVSRNATISGSDDLQRWFIIEENIVLERKFASDKDRYLQTLGFPSSSYHYYKLVIENGKNDPLNIEEAGRFIDLGYKSIYPYISNPAVRFRQKDSSDHYSYIFIDQSQPYHTEKISVRVEGPRFFKREVDLIKTDGTISAFQISSDSIFYFYVPSFNDKSWLLRISNGDNPPLHILQVNTEQESKKIVAYLEAGKHYNLFMQDSLATKPAYDLQQFKDSIPTEVQELKILSFEHIRQYDTQTRPSWTNKLLWPIIIIVIIVLSLLTLRLTREVEQKN